MREDETMKPTGAMQYRRVDEVYFSCHVFMKVRRCSQTSRWTKPCPIANSHCQDPEAVPRDVMKRVVSTQQDSQLWIALHKLSSDL